MPQASFFLARYSSTSSFAGVQLFGVLAERVVSGAAVFNPSDLGGDDVARFSDFVIHFVLDPALWRDLNGGDAVEEIVVVTSSVANGFRGAA